MLFRMLIFVDSVRFANSFIYLAYLVRLRYAIGQFVATVFSYAHYGLKLELTMYCITVFMYDMYTKVCWYISSPCFMV